MKTITMLVLLILLVPSVYSLTAAIGNARVVINVEASPEDPAIVDRTIKVINKNDVAVKIHLNPSIELRPFINVIDNDFVLQPGEEKHAAFVLTIDRGGNFDGAINVLFSPADPESKDNEVGLSSRVLIVSEGPIIEDPNSEEEEEGSEETIETPETNLEEVIENSTEVLETEPTENTKPTPIISDEKQGANPLIGVAIMAAILILGAGIFFAVMKLKK